MSYLFGKNLVRRDKPCSICGNYIYIKKEGNLNIFYTCNGCGKKLVVPHGNDVSEE